VLYNKIIKNMGTNHLVSNKDNSILNTKPADKKVKSQSLRITPGNTTFSQEYLKELAAKYSHLPKEILDDLASDKYPESL
jgi:hypothetical protein